MQPSATVDRSDADLAYKRRPAFGRLSPGGEQHADGSRRPPGEELRRLRQPGEITADRPDASAQARERVGRPLLEKVERIAAKDLGEREAGSEPGDPGADQPAEYSTIAQADSRCRRPQLGFVRRSLPTMAGAQHRFWEPAIKVKWGHGRRSSPIRYLRGRPRGARAAGSERLVRGPVGPVLNPAVDHVQHAARPVALEQ